MIKGFDSTILDMYELHIAKNQDYANAKDPYKNFRTCEKLGVCSTEEGILVRMLDKISRVQQLLKNPPKVKDEKIEDTLLDLANYAVIMRCYLAEKQRKTQ